MFIHQFVLFAKAARLNFASSGVGFLSGARWCIALRREPLRLLGDVNSRWRSCFGRRVSHCSSSRGVSSLESETAKLKIRAWFRCEEGEIAVALYRAALLSFSLSLSPLSSLFTAAQPCRFARRSRLLPIEHRFFHCCSLDTFSLAAGNQISSASRYTSRAEAAFFCRHGCAQHDSVCESFDEMTGVIARIKKLFAPCLVRSFLSFFFPFLRKSFYLRRYRTVLRKKSIFALSAKSVTKSRKTVLNRCCVLYQ